MGFGEVKKGKRALAPPTLESYTGYAQSDGLVSAACRAPRGNALN